MSNIRKIAQPFLNKTESLLKTDVRYIIRGSFWLNASTVVNTAILAGLTYAFGNYVEPEVYGQYKYFLSVYSILALAAFSGFNAAVARSAAHDIDGDLMRGFKIQSAGAILASVLSFCIAAYYYTKINLLLALGFLVIGLVLPLMESLDLYIAFLNGKKKFREIGITSVVSQIVGAIGVLIAIYYHADSVGILAAYFLSWMLVKAWYFYTTVLWHVRNKNQDPALNKLGLHLTAIDVLSDISSYLDKILLFHYLGGKEVAEYSFATAIPDQMKAVFNNLKVIIMPKFCERTEEEIRSDIMRKTWILGGSILALVLIYILFAPLLISIFLPKYTGITFYSQVYAFSLLSAVSLLPQTAMVIIPKIKRMYWINAIIPVVNITLLLTLIPSFGIWGAVAAKSLGRMFGMLITYIFFLV